MAAFSSNENYQLIEKTQLAEYFWKSSVYNEIQLEEYWIVIEKKTVIKTGWIIFPNNLSKCVILVYQFSWRKIRVSWFFLYFNIFGFDLFYFILLLFLRCLFVF